MNKKNNFSKNIKLFWILSTVTILSFFLIILFWAKKIEKDSYQSASVYASLYSLLLNNKIDDNTRSFLFDNILRNNPIPMIITDNNGNVQTWKNLQFSIDDKSEENLQNVKNYISILEKVNPPIKLKTKINDSTITIGTLYYGDYATLGFISYLPILLLGLSLIFAYSSFAGIKILKESENDKLFYGLAKETAHQLGTPISSLWGWIELIKIESGYNKEKRQNRRKTDMYIEEIETDIKRLEKINNRFELIGSKPIKTEEDINEIIDDVCRYFANRLPSNIKIESNLSNLPKIEINRTLFEWVFENLIKNSIDSLASEDSGEIFIETNLNKNNQIEINFWDNGRGIKEENIKNIFEPGFSTKQNGWGIGLTLIKRIIESFHNGKIELTQSQTYIKTNFRIILNNE